VLKNIAVKDFFLFYEGDVQASQFRPSYFCTKSKKKMAVFPSFLKKNILIKKSLSNGCCYPKILKEGNSTFKVKKRVENDLYGT